MKIYITDKNEYRTITLHFWDNGGWSPDIFGDLADTMPRDFPANGADAEAAMTDEEFRETVAWWEEEIRSYNNRERNNWFVENLSDDEIDAEYERGFEFTLNY